MTNKRIIITLGDPEGVSPEIISKSYNRIAKLAEQIIIIGTVSFLQNIKAEQITGQLPNKKGVFLFNIEKHKNGLAYLEKAMEILRQDTQWILLTMPVSKNRINKIDKTFTGHTDYFRNYYNDELLMCFVYENIRTSLLTEHIPLRNVTDYITKELIRRKIESAKRYLSQYFKIGSPSIIVSGLNPHCGDEGVLGNEEIIIKDAIQTNSLAHGPHSVEFILRNLQKFDLSLFCYHDQIVPLIKSLYPSCINMTLGLPFYRFAPAHGTGFDIAGKGIADTKSFEYIFTYINKYL
ncbi:MAG: 4-hydroxythreonine-4-phosphate dehydrogenase PdxA [Planctomycetes bacterium]|nr:4-hydroxythreonine-4-phosphate dehydrogenase PdxA [Planctomycetota bacterium]